MACVGIFSPQVPAYFLMTGDGDDETTSGNRIMNPNGNFKPSHTYTLA